MTWETIPQPDWRSWILKTLPNNALRVAWETNRMLVRTGKTFRYRVTPRVVEQGHWDITEDRETTAE